MFDSFSNDNCNSGAISPAIKGGMVGAIIVLIITVAVVVWIKPFDYRAVVIIDQAQVVNQSGPMLTVPESQLMSSLRDKGYLLTPAEYTNNMIGYYNTLIAFLAVFFVVFTIAGYFAIRGLSKKEVREEAREMLKDSQTFRSDISESIRGMFDGEYVQIEEYEQRLKDIEDNIASVLEATKKATVKKRDK